MKWPCIVSARDVYSFHCTVCLKNVSCAHQGERDVSRHIASVQHTRKSKGMESTAPLKFSCIDSTEKVSPHIFGYNKNVNLSK